MLCQLEEFQSVNASKHQNCAGPDVPSKVGSIPVLDNVDSILEDGVNIRELPGPPLSPFNGQMLAACGAWC